VEGLAKAGVVGQVGLVVAEVEGWQEQVRMAELAAHGRAAGAGTGVLMMES
jgi:hypothetical protein